MAGRFGNCSLGQNLSRPCLQSEMVLHMLTLDARDKQHHLLACQETIGVSQEHQTGPATRTASPQGNWILCNSRSLEWCIHVYTYRPCNRRGLQGLHASRATSLPTAMIVATSSTLGNNISPGPLFEATTLEPGPMKSLSSLHPSSAP